MPEWQTGLGREKDTVAYSDQNERKALIGLNRQRKTPKCSIALGEGKHHG